MRSPGRAPQVATSHGSSQGARHASPPRLPAPASFSPHRPSCQWRRRPPAPPGEPPADGAHDRWTKCPLARIDRQLVRCDVLTGEASMRRSSAAGSISPVAVRPNWRRSPPSGCTGGCGSGSTIGPDERSTSPTASRSGVADRSTHRRPDDVRHGLPRSLDSFGIGGAIDVAFLGHTAYVLVTLVGPELGQPGVVDGIYRVSTTVRPPRSPTSEPGRRCIPRPASYRRRQRSPVRPPTVPRRLPRDRWSPQPGARVGLDGKSAS